MKILNMLNIKYFIVPGEKEPMAQQNPGAYGNAWFINDVRWVESSNEEIIALADTDLTKTAIINNKFKDLVNTTISKDSTGTITLTKDQPNELVYKFSANADQVVVFSEMYYEHGWKSFIDGQEVPNFRVDYILRGLNVPSGNHTISFKFEPEVIKTGSTIAFASSILLILLLLGGLFYSFKNRNSAKSE